VIYLVSSLLCVFMLNFHHSSGTAAIIFRRSQAGRKRYYRINYCRTLLAAFCCCKRLRLGLSFLESGAFSAVAVGKFINEVFSLSPDTQVGEGELRGFCEFSGSRFE
jgi:hypothetical protein